VYGGQTTHRGESGYPSVRVVAMMALRSHVFELLPLRGLRDGRERTLGARDLERSPGELAGDRGPQLSSEERPHPFGDERQIGNWLVGAPRSNTKVGRFRETAGEERLLGRVGTSMNPACRRRGPLRAIPLPKEGLPRARRLLTSLLDPEQYPAEEARGSVSRSAGRRELAYERGQGRTCWISARVDSLQDA